jgi:hypothetical protein
MTAKSPAGEGQATVVVHAATKTKHTYETLYDGWGGGGWGRWRGFGGRFGDGVPSPPRCRRSSTN